ncbi:MAG: gliding motility-associated protein GldL [Bacteroidia bacterium]|jgi:gliding motility-associated protein GldL
MQKFNLLNFFYGLGAAIILIASLFKFVGWNGADTLFMVGLIGEAIIFLISGAQPIAKANQYRWDKVFPQLRNASVTEEAEAYNQALSLDAAEFTQEQQITKIVESILALNNSVETLNNATKKLTSYVENLETNYELVTNSTLDYHKEINSLKIKIASANNKLREFENYKF